MSRLSRNIVYNLAGQGALVILSFISAKYVYGELGGDALGVIYFALMLNTVVVAVLEMGVCATAVREISVNETRDPEYVIRIVRSGGFFYWSSFVVAAGLVVVAAPEIATRWLNLESMHAGDATTLLRILGVSVLLALPKTFYTSVFRGLQRMGTPNAIDVATSALQQTGTIVIIALGGTVLSVALWMAASYVVRVSSYGLLLARVLGPRALSPRLFKSTITRNLHFARHMMAISILAMVHTQIDKLLISSLLPVAMIGVYGLLYGAVGRGALLTSAVAQAAFPSLSAAVANKQANSIRHRYKQLQDALCIGLVPIFAGVPFVTLPVFSFVFGRDVAESLVAPATLLALGFYMNGTINVPYYVSLAMGKPEIASRQNFYALFVTLPITGLLTWEYGLVGAASGRVVYHLFAYAYGVPRICRECLEMSALKWFLHLLPIMSVGAATYGSCWLIIRALGEPTMVSLAVGYVTASLLYVSLSWLIVGPELRGTIVGKLRSLRRNAGRDATQSDSAR